MRRLRQGQGNVPTEAPGQTSNQASLDIDNFSRFSWISFLRTKTAAEICKVFREFKALVELKFSARITRFRCDNGKGE